MSTKYWNTEIKITDDIKKHLEDSLNGSHYQIAKTTYNIFKDRFRVDDVRNTTWYEFDGVRWKKSHLMNILISEELPKYYKGIKISDTSVSQNNLQEYLVNNEKMDNNMRNQLVDNIINKLENVIFKNNVLNQITYLYKTLDPDFYTNLDSHPHLVGFKNGVYDFNSNTFRQSKQSDYLTFSTGYDFVEYDETDENVQEIYEFLEKIVPNKKVREYMLKVLGKSLLGIPDEKFYIWTGLSGANGKSTLVNFLEYTLGDYITSVDVSLLTNRRANSSNASPDIIRLRGKRLFTFQEPEHDDKLRTGILKQYTGGDTINARELFKAPISFKLQGTMIMCCNDLPTVSSIDGGTWRRIRVIEFKSRFCENPVKPNEFKIDPFIKNKIQKWRPYLMSILIYWYNMFLLEGLQEPDEVKKATANYKDDNDKFNDFFDHCLEEDSKHFSSNKSIYNDCFIRWWETNYPNTRTPEMRELRRAMKIKYGNETEQVNYTGLRQKGFNVKIKCDLQDDITADDDM
jgi:P4 family phage/plasmid primase-like protien